MITLRGYQSRRWVPAQILPGEVKPFGVVRQTSGGEWERAGLLRQCYDGFKTGRRGCLVSATGSGKTVATGALLGDCVGAGWRVVFFVDRIALVGQSIGTFEQLNVPIGWVWRGRNEDRSAPLQVVSVASMEAGYGGWLSEWIGQENVLVVIDEAHELAFRTSLLPWIQDETSKTWFLYLTATPDSRGRLLELGDISDWLAVGPTYRELTEIPDPDVTAAYRAAGFDVEMGALVPIRYLPMRPEIDASKAKVGKNGEYKDGDLEVPACEPRVLEAVVRAWEEHALGLRSVGFCCTRKHATLQAQAFAARGHRAAVLVGDDTLTGWVDASGVLRRASRDVLNAALDAGELVVLMSCDAVSKGWDRRPVQCGIDLRPMAQRGSWIQKEGRVLRPSPETGKLEALWLDFAGNYRRFGPVSAITGWTLPKGRRPREKREGQEDWGKVCPSDLGGCGATVARQVRVCPECGYEWPEGEMDLSKFEGFRLVESAAVRAGYLGEIGERVRKREGKLDVVKPITTRDFGVRLLVCGRDVDGRAWKAWMAWRDGIERGQAVSFSGTVAKHGRYGTGPQTELKRVILEGMG